MSQGYLNVVVRAKEGAYDTIDNITKFALSEDDYEIIKEWIEPPISSILNNQITALKKQLTDTDYVVIKIAEGVAVKEDYAEVLKKFIFGDKNFRKTSSKRKNITEVLLPRMRSIRFSSSKEIGYLASIVDSSHIEGAS